MGRTSSGKRHRRPPPVRQGRGDCARRCAEIRNGKPERVLATFRRLDGAPVGEAKSGDENLRGGNVDSTTEKRRLDSSGEMSLNFSLSPGKTTGLIKLEKEITRVTFERALLKEEVSLERSRTEEKLRMHKQDEDAAMAKAGEMWSQAEKILQENDRLREKMDKAETEGIAMRKQYEEQIAHIKMEHMTRTQQLDRDLREARSENLLLNERFKTYAILLNGSKKPSTSRRAAAVIRPSWRNYAIWKSGPHAARPWPITSSRCTTGHPLRNPN
ncbi:uncharacterized protein LOC129589666 isoform X2 [Paramacrobiotus metropolitanus]|uniref:uncharacterized protein LOC129589666 isoform X2 n=1 Tax=Paramacrobiotus metropolitanus TaxID=2943436 RepID=UPI002445FC81|nr:uncharacterized protein LOC129589666 isoform X2 [Paramacrobiotus metropolitanus]